MNAGFRELKQRIEALGLQIIATERNSRHYAIRIRNQHGTEIIRTLSFGGNYRRRNRANEMAGLKRFARGQTHGLKLASKPQ